MNIFSKLNKLFFSSKIGSLKNPYPEDELPGREDSFQIINGKTVYLDTYNYKRYCPNCKGFRKVHFHCGVIYTDGYSHFSCTHCFSHLVTSITDFHGHLSIYKHSKMKNKIEHYSYSIKWLNKDECFLAKCAEFPSLCAHGNTQIKALKEIKSVVKESVKWLQEDGEVIKHGI